MLRFYGMISISDTLDETRLLQPSTFTGSKNICICKENGKFYESNGVNSFECSELNAMLKSQQAPAEVLTAPLPLAPTTPTHSTMVVVDGQNMDLQTFVNETIDTFKTTETQLQILNDFKTRFENIFNGGK